MADLWGDFLGGVGRGTDMPYGYAGLTDDQKAQVQQMGYYNSPDASAYTGTPAASSGAAYTGGTSAALPAAGGSGAATLYQPQGYSGLSASQVQEVNDKGYYTGAPAGATKPGQSLIDKLANAFGGDSKNPGTDLQKSLTDLGGAPQRMGGAAAAAPVHPYVPQNPYLNIYRRSSLDPATAYKSLLSGGLT